MLAHAISGAWPDLEVGELPESWVTAGHGPECKV
jgi:hypothetical protein